MKTDLPNKFKPIIKWIILALMAYAITFLFFVDRSVHVFDMKTLAQAFNNGNSILIAVVYAGMLFILSKLLKKRSKRVMIISAIGAIVFLLIEFFGYNLDYSDSLFPMGTRAFTAGYYIVLLLGYFSVFYVLLQAVFAYIEKNREFKSISKKAQYPFFTANKRTFFLLMGILVAAWFAYFIAFWPGMISWDSYWQLGQGFGVTPLTNHHPVVHTYMMTGVAWLGKALFGNIANGIALFIILQMFTFAAVLSYVIYYLAKKNVPIWVRIVLFVFFAVCPIFGIYSVTLWKDIWLAMVVLLYTLYLFEIITNTQEFFAKKKNTVLLGLLVICMCFFKNTGIYVFLLSFPFLFFVLRKYWKNILLMLLIFTVSFLGLRTALFVGGNIQEGSSKEMLSIPVQHIARVIYYNLNGITKEQETEIRKYLPAYETLGALYNPRLSDPVKNTFSDAMYDDDKISFYKVWLDILKDNPIVCLTATALNSYGYYYPGAVNWIVGYEAYYDFAPIALEQDLPKFDETYYDIKDPNPMPDFRQAMLGLNDHLRKIPVISTLFSIGAYFYLLFFCALLVILSKKKRLLIPLFALFAVWLTCLASPVYAEFRYAFPYILTTPIMLPLILKSIKQEEQD